MKIISTRVYRCDGKYRTRYYICWDGVRHRACIGAKRRAARLDDAVAATISRQLNDLTGGGSPRSIRPRGPGGSASGPTVTRR